MFGLGRRSRDVITLFHKPSSQASTRVLNMLKQVSATASETATIDQAGDHTPQNHIQRSEFDLEITEAAPTSDQLNNILDYATGTSFSNIVKGATSKEDAWQKLRESADAFQRPVIVDWNNGKAVAGEDAEQIRQMLNSENPDT